VTAAGFISFDTKRRMLAIERDDLWRGLALD
jgi:hypothetical protein